MTVTFIPGKSGNYQCLSTDMSGSLPISGVSWIGANLFTTDTREWYRVDENMYLVPLTYPISGSISAIVNGSDIQIGAVEIKDSTTNNRVKIVQGSFISMDDMAIAVHDANTISASLAIGGSAVWVNDGNITVDNVVSASLALGGSAVFVENFTTDGSAIWVDNIVSASLVAGGSTVAIEDKNITSNGFLSSVNIGDLTPWLITTSASQVINFGQSVNNLTLYASASPIYAKINSGSHCLYVAPSSNVSIEHQIITEITIMGASDISLRYDAQYI